MEDPLCPTHQVPNKACRANFISEHPAWILCSPVSQKPGGLTPQIAGTNLHFSILIALHRFIEIFYKRLNCPPLANQSDWLDGLVEILDINSAQATGEDGLAEIFIEVGRNMLRNKRFSLSPMGQCTTATDSQGTVYFDRNYFAFDKAAFDRICNEAGSPPSATKQKLKEKGILSGKTVNAQSYLTRIACYNAYGRVQSIRVYKFKREVFERLGEPPLI